MNPKLELLDAIDDIKEKLSSQEYLNLMSKLDKITLADNVIDKVQPNSSHSDIFINGSDIFFNGFNIVGPDMYSEIIISTRLANFFGISRNQTKVDIIRIIINYIKHYELQEYSNRSVIDDLRGSELKRALYIPINSQLTLYNLHYYI